MIEERLITTAHENVHKLGDTLPEELLDDVLDYWADLGDTDESFSVETRAAIEEGLEDIREGRTISLGDYKLDRDTQPSRFEYRSPNQKSGHAATSRVCSVQVKRGW